MFQIYKNLIEYFLYFYLKRESKCSKIYKYIKSNKIEKNGNI